MRDYNTVLNETFSYFEGQGMSIIGEGFQEISTNKAQFNDYVDHLLEGANANDAEAMRQLMENSNLQILTESAISGITPIASLSMPVIRKLWPKIGLKEAIKTEVAKTPRFVIAHSKPYMEDASGNRTYLPNADMKAGTNLHPGRTTLEANDSGLVASHTGNVNTLIASAGTTSGVITYTLEAKGTLEDIKVVAINGTEVHKKLDVINGATVITEGSDTYFFNVDPRGGTITVACTADMASKTLEIEAFESTEANEKSYSVSFEIDRKDVVIPTGQHINAPLPIEFIQDNMALYNIDATQEVVDVMTTHFAQRLDIELYEFLLDSEAQAGYPQYAFDVRPNTAFAGTPKAWREELKTVIDYAAIDLKNKTFFSGGSFAIIANPIDAQLISNVDWVFKGANAQVAGVDVDYSFGSYTGANNYKIVSSQNVAAGAMFLVYTPSTNTHMTYKYYPYSFNMESGYRDPNRPNVPSLMATKRHAMAEFLPVIAKLEITNNNTTQAYRP